VGITPHLNFSENPRDLGVEFLIWLGGFLPPELLLFRVESPFPSNWNPNWRTSALTSPVLDDVLISLFSLFFVLNFFRISLWCSRGIDLSGYWRYISGVPFYITFAVCEICKVSTTSFFWVRFATFCVEVLSLDCSSLPWIPGRLYCRSLQSCVLEGWVRSGLPHYI